MYDLIYFIVTNKEIMKINELIKAVTKDYMPIRTNNGYVVDVKNGKPTVLATPSEAFRTIATHDDMTFIIGQRGGFMELWLLKNGEAALINDRIESIRTKYRHLILCLDNGKIQVISY